MRSLTGNYTTSHRDPEKILKEHKEFLPLDLFTQIKRVLQYHNLIKLIGYVTEDQHRKPVTTTTPRLKNEKT